MANLEKWQDIMKNKRRHTPFREYLKTIAGLRTLNFYKNNWFTTIYPPDTDKIKGIISHKEFDEIRDDLIKYGINYDDSKDFFENFKQLFLGIDFAPTVLFGECENANFTDQTVSAKNGYLSFVVIQWCENVLYSFSVKENSMNVFNSVMVWDHCENVYFSKGIIKSYNVFYSKHIINGANIWLSNNLIGCTDCIECENLENQSYCVNNKKLDKESYFLEKNKILQEKWLFLSKYEKLSNRWTNYGSNSVNGIFNIQCENIENGWNNYQIKNGRNIMFIGWKDPWENIYDCFLNTPHETDVYGVFSTGYCDNIYNSYQVNGGTNIYYSCKMESCSFCLWCVWLKNKSYCILNKQYTKEEWYELADKIFARMDADGTLGNFFPWELNPFYFNDTAAYLIDDTFTKEEVEKEWYLWRDEAIKVDIPEWADIIETKDLGKYQGFDANGNWTIQEDILKKVIRDEKGNFYKIVPMELEFLQKHKLPLPEIHWLERIKMGFQM